MKSAGENFIKKAYIKHNGKFNYSKVNYINSITKVIIICKEHGEFSQRPDAHTNRGDGCPLCKADNMRSNVFNFVEKASLIHKDRYDYNNVIYKGVYENVEIICKIHGCFTQTPNSHLKGRDCPKCNEYNLKLDKEEFIKKAIKIHGDRYNYDNINYIDSRTKLEIMCYEHGIFNQLSNNHLQNHGCPLCDKSKGEIKIENLLKENYINYKTQYTFDDLKDKRLLKFDFGILDKRKDLKCLIEFNGKQHYTKDDFMHKTENDFNDSQHRDQLKINYCNENNIPLYIIRYDENITERLQKIINKYGKENSKN